MEIQRRMIKKCLVCQTEFRTYPSKVNIGRGKYCSKACSDSITLIKKGQHLSPDTQIKKGEPLPEHVWIGQLKSWGIKEPFIRNAKKNVRYPRTGGGVSGRETWNKGKKGVCKPSPTSFKKGHHYSKSTEFKPSHTFNSWNEANHHLRSGENHCNWKGGKSFEPYPLGWTRTFKEQIRRRDEYKCQMCGMPECEHGRRMSVHHIDYNKSNLDCDNLISLCTSCHTKTNWNRKKWQKCLEGGDARVRKGAQDSFNEETARSAHTIDK